MPDFTDDDVTAGARTLIGSDPSPESIEHWSVEVRAILAAVAPAIYKRGWGEGLKEGYNEGWDSALREAAAKWPTLTRDMVSRGYVREWLLTMAEGSNDE